MITEPTAAPARRATVAMRHAPATRISGPVDRRLRLAALVHRAPLNQFLDSAARRALPAVGELAEQIQGGHDEH